MLQHPGEEFHSLDLLTDPAAGFASAGISVDAVPNDGSLSVRRLGDAGEMLDAKAKQENKRRLIELREKLEDQRELGNPERAAEIESEIDFLAREISRAVGLSGRDRRAGSAAERARLNVTRAIKAALQKISEHEPALSAMLDKSIKTGSFCSYAADSAFPIQWQFSIESGSQPVAVARTQPLFLRQDVELIGASAHQTKFVGRELEHSLLVGLLERTMGAKQALP